MIFDMVPEPDPASTVADDYFLPAKLKEFAKFKKELFNELAGVKGMSDDLTRLIFEVQNNADILYSDILLIYGYLIEEKECGIN